MFGQDVALSSTFSWFSFPPSPLPAPFFFLLLPSSSCFPERIPENHGEKWEQKTFGFCSLGATLGEIPGKQSSWDRELILGTGKTREKHSGNIPWNEPAQGWRLLEDPTWKSQGWEGHRGLSRGKIPRNSRIPPSSSCAATCIASFFSWRPPRGPTLSMNQK